MDDELAEEATTAEQAVPWLIGVILLLAGMVIVLLALIFAGDASLGGGAGGSPTPSAVAFVPGASGADAQPHSEDQSVALRGAIEEPGRRAAVRRPRDDLPGPIGRTGADLPAAPRFQRRG